MADTLAELHRQMAAAAERSDYEAAARLRDRISLMRSAGTTNGEADFDPTGLTRQQPGAMGLGTNQQRMTPPEGWKPPKKPDPMTSGTSRRGRKR